MYIIYEFYEDFTNPFTGDVLRNEWLPVTSCGYYADAKIKFSKLIDSGVNPNYLEIHTDLEVAPTHVPN